MGESHYSLSSEACKIASEKKLVLRPSKANRQGTRPLIVLAYLPFSLWERCGKGSHEYYNEHTGNLYVHWSYMLCVHSETQCEGQELK